MRCLRAVSWMVSDVLNLLWPATVRQELAAVRDSEAWYKSRCEELAGIITAEELARIEEEQEVLEPVSPAASAGDRGGAVRGIPSPPAPPPPTWWGKLRGSK